jgi:exopolyphosphatase/guanosine-5'-triphosphate,3'-diphosphate pyrophosphatase
LLERLQPADPPRPDQLAQCRGWISDFLRGEVHPLFAPFLGPEAARPMWLVGTGGTSSVMATMHLRLTTFDRERIESVCLGAGEVRRQLELLWSLPLAERRHVIGLPPPRADVILTGLAIHEGIMDTFQLTELRVSTRGIRFAAVMENALPFSRNPV